MGYDGWWIIFACASDFGILIFFTVAGFKFLIAVADEENPKKSGIVFLISILVVGTAFVFDVHFHYRYAEHYQALRAAEVISIIQTTKENPLSVVDQGTDPQFPNLRDVLALMPGGEEENFYYDPSTKKAIFNEVTIP